jgi:putative hydrolase of the HAD superfamily
MTVANPDWNQVDTVLVDLDGTLLDLGFDNRFWRSRIPRAYAIRHGLEHDDAWRHLLGLFEATRGTLDGYCIDYWSRALDLDIAALKRAARHEVAWLPQAREFLAAVRASGRRLVLVTNAHPETLAIKDSHAGVVRFLDRAISSHEFHAPKEHDGFWRALAAGEAVDPARMLFLDDTLDVLAAARRFGIGQVIGIHEPVAGAGPRAPDEFAGVVGVRDLIAGLHSLRAVPVADETACAQHEPAAPRDLRGDQVAAGAVGG